MKEFDKFDAEKRHSNGSGAKEIAVQTMQWRSTLTNIDSTLLMSPCRGTSNKW